MEKVVGFQNFVRRSPSAFHAIDAICEELKAKGYTQLQENHSWKLEQSGRYFVTRNRSSVIAFTTPKTGLDHFQIVASHSDAPTFKLKPNAEDVAAGKYVRLNTERYGGMQMATWFDRPLSIAGRVMVREDHKIVTKLVNLDKDTVMIPTMPIHFNRDANNGFSYNAQVDTLPLYGTADAKGQLIKDIAAACGVEPEQIVGSDLFLYDRTPASIWGANGEYFSCGKIDDLECAYTSFCAFIDAEITEHVNVLAVFDNEEVGSRTKQGAASTFLEDVIFRVCAALGLSDAEARAAMLSSFMVSADNAHAVHPNHPEKYDVGNRTFMNEGVVIKHNANQSYTTDAVSDAIFSEICAATNVPVQHFANRSDVAGGGTLGNIANSHTSMNTVDIGLPQLGMHSAYETAGVKDVEYMISALHKFYETEINMNSDGEYTIR